MIENIHWLGHDTFRIENDRTIYIDPYELKGKLPKADLILITHDHSDHLSPKDVAKVAKEDTVIVTVAAAAKKLKGDVRVVKPADSLIVLGIPIETVPAYNVNKFRSSMTCQIDAGLEHHSGHLTKRGQSPMHPGIPTKENCASPDRYTVMPLGLTQLHTYLRQGIVFSWRFVPWMWSPVTCICAAARRHCTRFTTPKNICRTCFCLSFQNEVEKSSG